MFFEDILAQTDLLIPLNKGKDMAGYYFIAAHTDTGARFYSEPLRFYNEAEKTFDSYCDLVNYYEGGTVELFAIDPDDFSLLATARL